MKKPFVFLLHFGYWSLYLLLLSVIFTIASIQIKKTSFFNFLFPLIFLCVVPNLLSFYASYFLLFSRFLRQKKFIVLLVFGTLICIVSAFSGTLVSLILFGFEQPIFTEMREFFALLASFFLVAVVHATIALVIRGFITWYGEIKLKEELAQKNFEMELALIKSQINPHFLFNTINNIDVLITKNSVLASAYLNKLSDILRYMVYETRSEKIPLTKELDYIEKYLELQKIRTTNPDYVNFEKPDNLECLKIAPMILFPFIENAFKHTEISKNLNSIHIKAALENERFIFICENSYQRISTEKKEFGGLGNDLIKKRLTLIYPERHILDITDNGRFYSIKLTIDLKDI